MRKSDDDETDDMFFRGFAAGQRAMPKGTFILQDSPELMTLRERVAALEAERDRLRDALAYIATYPAKGSARRTRQGYPAEVLYDEFAYKRIVDSYRDYARAALGDGQ